MCMVIKKLKRSDGFNEYVATVFKCLCFEALDTVQIASSAGQISDISLF